MEIEYIKKYIKYFFKKRYEKYKNMNLILKIFLEKNRHKYRKIMQYFDIFSHILGKNIDFFHHFFHRNENGVFYFLWYIKIN